MRIIFTCFAALFLWISSHSAKAQGDMDFRLHRYNYQGIKTIGISGGYQWNPFGENRKGKSKKSVGAEANIFFPTKFTSSFFLIPVDTAEEKSVSVTDKVSFYQINAYAKYYIVGTFDNSTFGWYFKLGFGYMLARYSTKIGQYDKSEYLDLGFEEESGIIGEFMFQFGTGIEVNVSGGTRIVLEGAIFIPPNQTGSGVSEQAYAAKLGGSATANIGVRIPFASGGVRDTRAGASSGRVSSKRIRSHRSKRKSYLL